jgi:hypothetical protein
MHGLLAGKSEISDFDPMLFHDLYLSSLTHGPSESKTYWNAICRVSVHTADRQQEFIKLALIEQENLPGALATFYRSRLLREEPADLLSRQKKWEFIKTSILGLGHRRGLGQVCNLFANWKFDHDNDHVSRTHKSAKKLQNGSNLASKSGCKNVSSLGVMNKLTLP